MSKYEQSEHERERPLRVARHRRHLADALENYSSVEGIASIEECERLAQLLFALTSEAHGLKAARRIFARYGAPLITPLQQKELGVIDRLSIVKLPNAKQLAKDLATARRTNPDSELRAIERVKAKYKSSAKRARIAALQSRITALRTKIKKLPEAPARPGSMLKTEDVPEAKEVLEAEIARLQEEIDKLS